MDEFLKELKEIRHVSFATVRDGKPRSRILDIMSIEDKGFYFLTGKQKDIYKEIQNNKYIALNVMLDDFRIYRVEGEVEFKGNKEYLLSINPEVAKLYEGHEENLVPFYINIKYANKFSIINGKPNMENFSID